MIRTIKELAARLGRAVSRVKKAKAAGLIERNNDGSFERFVRLRILRATQNSVWG